MLDFPKAFIRRLTGAGVVESGQLRILAFETARAMSRLVALHRIINQTFISVLQNTIAQSPGVAYLNYSVDDKDRVVQIACAEMLDELDQVAAVISRLSARCVFAWPREFSQVYAGLKSGCDGVFNQKLCVPAKVVEGRVRKMESYVASALNLYAEMGVLSEMEASERRLERWIDHSGPIPAGEGNKETPPGADAFLKNIGLQRKLVRKLQDQTLWCRNRDKISELMAGVAVAIFLRICVVFGNHVPHLPAVKIDRNGKFDMFRTSTPTYHMSGPLLSSTRAVQKQNLEITKFSGPLWLGRPYPFPPSPVARPKIDLTKWTAKTLSPLPGSVGSAGLALRYAEIIVLCEKMFQSPHYCTVDERDELFRMLPKSFRNILREKLRKSDQDGGGVCIGAIKKASRVLDQLGPMAHDTINHLSETSYEKHKLDSSPKVLMLQTLHNSDQNKTEAAIVDVLLGLSALLKKYLVSFD